MKLVLVALKCDLRKSGADDDEESQPEKSMINYQEGLQVAERIKALRYLGNPTSLRWACSCGLTCFQNAQP